EPGALPPARDPALLGILDGAVDGGQLVGPALALVVDGAHALEVPEGLRVLPEAGRVDGGARVLQDGADHVTAPVVVHGHERRAGTIPWMVAGSASVCRRSRWNAHCPSGLRSTIAASIRRCRDSSRVSGFPSARSASIRTRSGTGSRTLRSRSLAISSACLRA